MSRSSGLAALRSAGLAAAIAVAVPSTAAASPAQAPPPVHVDSGPSRLEATLGDPVTLRSSVGNDGPAATTSLIAHLDVVSLDPDVYVDPEDWSSKRSVEIEPLPPGGTTDLSWPIRTVDSGDFAVYVVLMPVGQADPAPLTGSPPTHLTVHGRRAVTGGGTLPVDLGVPLLLALVLFAGRLRRRAGTRVRPKPDQSCPGR